MRWTVPRLDSFEYQRIDASGRITGVLDNVTRCRITENLNTAIKASGQLLIAGQDTDIGDDLIRVMWTAEEADDSTTIALGTFRASTPKRTRSSASVTATVELYSQLLVLDETTFRGSYVVPSGSDPLAVAQGIAEDCGLTVVMTPPASTMATNVDMVFDAETSKLGIINELLSFAGYGSACVDGYGRVVMAPYERPADRTPIWTFRDDEASIIIPGIEDELDWYHIPNVVVVTMSNLDETITKTAVDDDPESPYSTIARGREITRHERITDALDEAAVQAKADLLLETSQTVVNTIGIRHTWAPFGIGDVIRVLHAGAGIDYRLVAQSRVMNLVPGVSCQTSARRFVGG